MVKYEFSKTLYIYIYIEREREREGERERIIYLNLIILSIFGV